MNILIITGGSSSERKISLLSAKTVKAALESNGHEVTSFDFKKGYTQLKKIIRRFDAIFPVMHGKEGEDGTLYRFLKSAKVPYVGSDPKGANIASNKIAFKKYCDKQGIRTAEWIVIKTAKDILRFRFPCVLKAAHGGSSHEVIFLHSEKDLVRSQVKRLLRSGDQLFVEKVLVGTEVTAGLLGRKALPVLEIIPPGNGWFDYKNKYSGETQEIPFAPSVKPRLQKRMQQIALRIHRDLALGSFSRTDIIIVNQIPYVLEVNTPGGVGLTSESLFPRAAKATGLSFPQLMEKIITSV